MENLQTFPNLNSLLEDQKRFRVRRKYLYPAFSPFLLSPDCQKELWEKETIA